LRYAGRSHTPNELRSANQASLKTIPFINTNSMIQNRFTFLKHHPQLRHRMNIHGWMGQQADIPYIS
jgi:hypothetical protein